MRTVTLPDGEAIPVLGQGTWFMGERRAAAAEEVAALRRGLDLGMNLIDTAEMYANGGAEEVTGQAIAGRRDDVFLVSKVVPSNASREGTVAACERSLARLNTDRIDLYLLHWPGRHPLSETLAGFERLKADGKIRHWGVSNFDVDEMEDLREVAGGKACAANQILYNLTRRGPEFDLLPWCRDHRVPVMAYSPIEQGRLPQQGALAEVARRHDATPFQVALAWVLREPGVVAIPKASRIEHVEANRHALDLRLSDDDLEALDTEFAPPRSKQPLDVL